MSKQEAFSRLSRYIGKATGGHGEDRGDSCAERMPLHSRCYQRGNY